MDDIVNQCNQWKQGSGYASCPSNTWHIINHSRDQARFLRGTGFYCSYSSTRVWYSGFLRRQPATHDVKAVRAVKISNEIDVYWETVVVDTTETPKQ